MSFEELTPEQKKRARACKSPEELLTLVASEGFELSDEELETISGGSWCTCDDYTCGDDCYPECDRYV